MKKTCKQCEHFVIFERAGVVHQFCVAQEPQDTPKVNCAFFKSAQQSAHLTALRRGLAVSILLNVVLLAVALVVIGGR